MPPKIEYLDSKKPVEKPAPAPKKETPKPPVAPPAAAPLPETPRQPPTLMDKVKHWFISLRDGTETVHEFKGRISLGEGALNLILALAFFAVFFWVISLAATLLKGGFSIILLVTLLAIPLVVIILSMLAWLITTGIYHFLASLLGGKGSFKDYAALLSFPLAGSIILNVVFSAPLTAMGVLFLQGLEILAGLVSFVIGIIQLIAQVKITKEEYGLSTARAVATVLIPTFLIGVLLVGVVVAASVGLYFWVTAFTGGRPAPTTPLALEVTCMGAGENTNGTIFVYNVGNNDIGPNVLRVESAQGKTYTISENLSANGGYAMITASDLGAPLYTGTAGGVYGSGVGTRMWVCQETV
jgi:hypothetical protein